MFCAILMVMFLFRFFIICCYYKYNWIIEFVYCSTILQPVLNSLTSSNLFFVCVSYIKFSNRWYFLQIKTSLFYPFQSKCLLLIFFLPKLNWVRFFSTMSDRSTESGLKGKVISLSPLKLMLAIDKCPLISWGISFYFWDFLWHIHTRFCKVISPCLLRWSVFVFVFLIYSYGAQDGNIRRPWTHDFNRTHQINTYL